MDVGRKRVAAVRVQILQSAFRECARASLWKTCIFAISFLKIVVSPAHSNLYVCFKVLTITLSYASPHSLSNKLPIRLSNSKLGGINYHYSLNFATGPYYYSQKLNLSTAANSAMFPRIRATVCVARRTVFSFHATTLTIAHPPTKILSFHASRLFISNSPHPQCHSRNSIPNSIQFSTNFVTIFR